MRCAFGAHIDVGLAERPTPCRFILTVRVSIRRFREDGRPLMRPIAGYEPCTALFLLPTKIDALVAVYGGEAASSCPRSGQLRTPNKKEPPDEKKSRHQDNVLLSTS